MPPIVIFSVMVIVVTSYFDNAAARKNYDYDVKCTPVIFYGCRLV